MPPYASLSPRDGRPGASYALAKEPYYSNEDVQVVHETVLAAEEILPDLAERDRLPTNALFRAAEDVLPRHGYDADDSPNISRLLFRIGGMRGGGGLLNKFESVLGSMGIELEYTNTVDAVRPPPSEVSVASAGSSVGTFPLGMQYSGRRRRHSDSVAQQIQAGDEGRDEPARHVRAASFESSVNPGPDRMRAGYDKNAHGQRELRAREGAGEVPLSEDQDTDPENNDYTVPDSELDDNLTQESYDPGNNLPMGGQASRDLGMEPPEWHDGRISRFGFGSDEFRGASDTTVHTLDEEAGGLPDQMDVRLAKKKVNWFWQTTMRREKLNTWREVTYYTKRDRQIREQYAARLDSGLVIEEVLDIWRENAGLPKYEYRNEPEIPHDQQVPDDHIPPPPPTEEEPNLTEVDAMRKRKADRAYALFTLDKAFDHWRTEAREAKERTEVARRHILRKRYFSAWRDQDPTDNDKIVKFALANAVRLWQVALARQREEQELAARADCQHLLRAVFWNWLQGHQEQAAVVWCSTQTKKACLRTWRSASQAARETWSDAVYFNAQCSAEKCVSSWARQHQKVNVLHDTLKHQHRTCQQQVFTVWRKESTLTKLLRETRRARHERLGLEAVDKWRKRARESKLQIEKADRIYLEGIISQWRNETNLQLFRAQFDEALLAESMYHWVLQERLVFFRRYRDDEAKSHVLRHLCAASKRAKADRDQMERVAHELDEWSTKAIVFNRLDEGAQEQGFLQREAAAILSVHDASRALTAWSDHHAKLQKTQSWADRGAFYVRVTNTLQRWKETASITKEERVRTTYHAFRRQYKVKTALQCLDKWRVATEDVVVSSWEADQISATQDQEDLEDMLAHWNGGAQKMHAYADIADGAFQEVCFGRWRQASQDWRALAIDAEDYDANYTLQSCLANWELESVQQRARLHTATELREKSNRKLSRHVLGYWRQEALPYDKHVDLQFSYASRPGGLPGGSSLLFPALQGESRWLGPMSEFDDDARLPTSRFGSSQLQQPMRESGGGSYISASRDEGVRRRDQSHGQQEPDLQISPSRRRSSLARPSSSAGNRDEPLMTLTRSGSSRLFEEPRSLVYRPRRGFDSTPQRTPQPAVNFAASGSAFPSGVGQRPLSEIEEEPRSGPGPAKADEPTAGALPPMSEFDDDDEERLPVAADREIGAERGTPAPSSFANTPTRWTGVPRPFVRRFTTTPRAPLPSPFERQLRDEYGGSSGGLLRAASIRRSMGRQQTPGFVRERSEEQLGR